MQQYSYSSWLPVGAGNKTLSSDPEILLHCILTMTKGHEIETPVGSVLLCGKYYQMKGKKNKEHGERSAGSGPEAAEGTAQIGLCRPFGGQGCNWRVESLLTWNKFELDSGSQWFKRIFLFPSIIPVPYNIPISPLWCNSRWGLMCMTRQVSCYWAHSHKTFIVPLFWVHLQQCSSAAKALFLLTVR